MEQWAFNDVQYSNPKWFIHLIMLLEVIGTNLGLKLKKGSADRDAGYGDI